MKHHFTVVTPEMSEVIPILDYGQGPREYFRLSTTVECENKRDAKVLALKSGELQEWITEARGDGINPLSGLEVYSPVCSHGICLCEPCGNDCLKCMEGGETNA